MKQRILKLSVLALLLAGTVSCGNDDSNPKIKVCNVENPLTDLPWLKKFIDESKQGHQVSRMKIYQSSYDDGKIGFLIDICEGCPDAGLLLTNCEGENLCVLGGLAGDLCTDFKIDFENKKLIWKNYL
ncbi:MAG: hypothetical protein LBU57_08675 [Dysgonamonadaceae bacterium]|jgi:hypothetical protein|nr:hypothetical protein [Dysgonamonadaceae bacterium]